MPRFAVIVALVLALVAGILWDFIPPALMVVFAVALGFLIWTDAKKDDSDGGRYDGDSEGRW